ncbi:MAG: hypothetical protein ACYDAM_02625 [Leptospirales bacterium]
MTAGGAGLACVVRGTPDQTSAGLRQLVVQEAQEGPHPLDGDGAVQSELLPDVFPGGIDHPPGGAGHVPEWETLDEDDHLGIAVEIL